MLVALTSHGWTALPYALVQLERHAHLHSSHGQRLLDTNWNAKISDFGLSNIVPANKKFPFNISHEAGTFGYRDPHDAGTKFLTKGVDDIRTFGVVLFEVRCGRLCAKNYKDGYPLLSDRDGAKVL
ncbi:hypothetical protein L1987_86911 [Smallanthus sonchifolius]|uniref:Uncharacterized protein n=1 Tax=Smallanthus sonchifolius TaxID=185202 RepID=A0ACB8Y1D5_9ASTR|nr:hypothetical protein L1987_86911 [Smallanthus sonchifolius]